MEEGGSFWELLEGSKLVDSACAQALKTREPTNPSQLSQLIFFM
ncbi:hypothetical protein [Mycoplasmoides fastidiosum]|nr:hypothetical protein [Mycoplasmoides fastidiosum]UUD37355.1 hypothetical protein NPA10_02100 [Mycoplasmoides fastidiosum]